MYELTERNRNNDESSIPLYPAKKELKARKWQEIEAFKAKQRLVQELFDIDPSFIFSSTDLL